MALHLGEGEPRRLRVFFDGSVLEVVANKRVMLSERIYPTRADSREIGVFATGGPAHLRSLDRWAMHSI